MNVDSPLALWVLHTTMGTDVGVGHRAFLFLTQRAAHIAGDALKATKPHEATIFEFMVLQLESYDGAGARSARAEGSGGTTASPSSAEGTMAPPSSPGREDVKSLLGRNHEARVVHARGLRVSARGGSLEVGAPVETRTVLDVAA